MEYGNARRPTQNMRMEDKGDGGQDTTPSLEPGRLHIIDSGELREDLD